MKLSQFDFPLPSKLIAQYPSELRDEARLLVGHRKNGKIEHKRFKDLIGYFGTGDTIVLNNTKVFPARLHGIKEKTNATIEVFLLRELDPTTRLWDVLVDPARKIRIGNKLFFGEGDILVAEVVDNTTSRGRTLRFLFDGTAEEFKERLYKLGTTPLPASVGRKVEAIDDERYQTIYAQVEGAVAAPSAGLHISRELLKRCEIKGINQAYVTLHAGLGNFRRIEVEDLSKHKADAEQIEIPESAERLINASLDEEKQVLAVGTTVIRTLESSVTTDQRVKAFSGWTNKFIFPPYRVQIPTAIVSNFHLPSSSLLMTVASFTGYDFMREMYDVAIKEEYTFGTYGDAMLVL
ncbi:MAG: tRNA preQ1(34) S-adenosylmethionine ribosyltransferase-isomerase QueA [Bacteroidia bacterium]|nr:MAG: tRNA preQ1(34) S-adenosylmethionine ribosyltransferase-isomerase QueA [Bacteroidia bacterium]